MTNDTLTSRQAKKSADRFLNQLNDSSQLGKTSESILYQVNTRPFGHSRKGRLINKVFHIPLFVLKRSLRDYLTLKSSTDSTLLEESRGINDKIAAIPEMIDQKMYEVMKLNDRLKSELMAEINKDQSPIGEEQKIVQKWVNIESKKLKKLNLGSGSHIMDGYINVDHREIEGVDLVCDIADIPLEKNTIEEIYTAHVVEHFTEYHIKNIFKHWYDLLAKDGKLIVIVPDIESMIREYSKGEVSWESLRLVILGGQDYNSDYHFNMFSKEYLKSLLVETLPNAGVEVVASGRRNGEALEIEVVVTK